MSDTTLEDILSCPSLPSMPAVAAQVIELVGDPEVSIDDLSSTIIMDQGLSAKILRTANSSFYAVRTKTTTIDRALVQLGLSAVKTLALGFALVDALKGSGGDGFDHEAYWRRSLFTAVSARVLAEKAKVAESNEAFLGGLLSEIGMIAMNTAIGPEYADVLAATDGDHRKLVKEELAAFDLQHPEIGAMLATRWKLPDEMVLPIKYHERPTAAPAACTNIVRSVGLGGYACDVMINEDPSPALRTLYTRASEWFKLSTDTIDEALAEIRTQVKEAGRLFDISPGETPDVDGLLSDARERLIEVAEQEAPSFMGLEEIEGLDIEVDEPTGALVRASFDSGVEALCIAGREGPEPITVVGVLAEGLESCGTPQNRDQFLRSKVTLLRKHFDPLGAVVGRLSASLMVVAIRGAEPSEIVQTAERFKAEYASAAPGWLESIEITRVAVGMGTATEAEVLAGVEPMALIGAAVRGVQESLAGGCQQVVTPALRLAAA
ncbi:MAG: HDOD domain-containing protein [Planctomycetota bacterium]